MEWQWQWHGFFGLVVCCVHMFVSRLGKEGRERRRDMESLRGVNGEGEGGEGTNEYLLLR